MNLRELQAWQAEKPSRMVDIKIQRSLHDDKNETVVWVYDVAISEGQYITDMSEIDLDAVKERADRAKLAELTKKYGEAL
jgi:hypothetical protein